jgi:hypothetical protein
MRIDVGPDADTGRIADLRAVDLLKKTGG